MARGRSERECIILFGSRQQKDAQQNADLNGGRGAGDHNVVAAPVLIGVEHDLSPALSHESVDGLPAGSDEIPRDMLRSAHGAPHGKRRKPVKLSATSEAKTAGDSKT